MVDPVIHGPHDSPASSPEPADEPDAALDPETGSEEEDEPDRPGDRPATDIGRKMEMVLQLLAGKTPKILAREAGYPRKQLIAWRRRFLEGGEAYLSGRNIQGELKRLEERNQELAKRTQELELQNLRLKQKLETSGERRPGPRTAEHPNCSAEYARAFEEGNISPLYVPEWRTHVLVRRVPGLTRWHATGLQPHTSLDPECDLKAGLLALKTQGIASISLITDPLWSPDLAALQSAFDSCRPFKEVYFIDRDAQRVQLRKRHRNIVNNARKMCAVRSIDFADHLDTWWTLYREHVETQAIGQPFSRSYFERLSGLDSLAAFAVFAEDEIVTITLWLRFGEILYYHDGASNERGHALSASYAAFAHVIDAYLDCRFVFFGGSAGIRDSREEGLALFKRGFANASAMCHLCHSILSRPGQPSTES